MKLKEVMMNSDELEAEFRLKRAGVKTEFQVKREELETWFCAKMDAIDEEAKKRRRELEDELHVRRVDSETLLKIIEAARRTSINTVRLKAIERIIDEYLDEPVDKPHIAVVEIKDLPNPHGYRKFRIVCRGE